MPTSGDDRYDAIEDPYCYPGTAVLKNIPALCDAAALERFELASTAQHANEPMPAGRLSVPHYRAVHRHLFQNVYGWAGTFRTVRLTKAGSAFCYPEHIAREMKRLFSELKRERYFRGLDADAFSEQAAHFLATLNAIQPRRSLGLRKESINAASKTAVSLSSDSGY